MIDPTGSLFCLTARERFVIEEGLSLLAGFGTMAGAADLHWSRV